MDHDEPAELDDEELEAFLGNGGTGVMSFATGIETAPYSIPVSYGYDATTKTFYFRLAVDPDSEKGDPTERPTTFVTYGQRDDVWQSVVARGWLEKTDERSIATETLEGFERVQIPLVDIFGRPPRDIPFRFYRLIPEKLTSRKESPTPL